MDTRQGEVKNAGSLVLTDLRSDVFMSDLSDVVSTMISMGSCENG